MASRLWKHLLRAKSKAENIGLFALYSSFFFICCLSAPLPTFGYYRENSTHSPNVNCCIWAIIFSSRAGLEGAGFLHLTECTVNFDHNATTPQIVENALPRVKPSFSKMWKCCQFLKQV